MDDETTMVTPEPETPREAKVIKDTVEELATDGSKPEATADDEAKAKPRKLAVLYRVRSGRTNEPLRYSLRSLANVAHGDVFVVGTVPAWVKGVKVIKPEAYRTTWRALTGELHRAAKRLAGQRVLLMDDDTFILRKVKAADLAPAHAGSLAADAQSKAGSYRRTLLHTAEYLKGLGIEDPLSYELHTPLVFEADDMAEVLGPVVDHEQQLQARSIYGNLKNIGGEQADDVRRRGKGTLPETFLSTSPGAWRYYQPQLAELFPDPSPYER